MKGMNFMLYTISFYFCLFLLYAVFGWIMEVIVCSIPKRKLVDRGFLIGPYCPIYGYAALLMIFSLEKYNSDPLALFVMATLICTILEYITSYVMEKLFHARWWDYSNKPFNINGRVCLTNCFFFGILGLGLVYFINPFFIHLLDKIPELILIIVGISLFLVFLIDNAISFNIMFKVKTTKEIIKKDSTEEITKKVREALKNKSFLHRRLMNAFPNLEIKLKELKEKK